MTQSTNQPTTSQQAIWMDLRRRFVPGQEEIHQTARRESSILLKSIIENIDVFEPIEVSSHRKFLGPVIVGMKRFVMRLMKPVIKIGLSRQMSINENVLMVATLLTELQTRVTELQQRVETLEQAAKK